MNRLQDSTSLYLRQHAANPVRWQPWDETALAQARAADRPILLSIGYSACHWCHVMAHESFEDVETAEVMNRLFINIKVDREEQPELDKVYQLAHQILTGRGGGWPLTVFLDPQDLTPFYAGTYFPPVARHNLPAFREVLTRLRDWFDTHRDDVRGQSERLREAVSSIQSPPSDTSLPDAAVFEHAASQYLGHADPVNGGLGGAPKFPQAPLLALLPVLARRSDDQRVQDAWLRSLEHMSRGGLRDQLDGGFFRYTVDADWTIPHFEKMLYDNALLLPEYARAAKLTGSDWLGEVTAGIAAWMNAGLGHEDGGFSASIDADADGREGGFHVWTREQMAAALNGAELQAACAAFGLDQPANFENAAWHLTRRAGAADAALTPGLCEKLLKLRSERVPPTTDQKRLTAWNALAVNGYALAGGLLDQPQWLDVAAHTLDWLRVHCWRDGRLLAVYAGGAAHRPANLDDHAFLLLACTTLLRYRWRPATLRWAGELADALLERFGEPGQGGFWFSAADQTVPMQRLRLLQDDATPGGNGCAALALLRLGRLLGETRYLDAAEGVLRSAAADCRKYPLGHATLLRALDEFLDPVPHVVISGHDMDALRTWSALTHVHDRLHCYTIGADAGGPALADPGEHRVVARICVGQRCLAPVTEQQEFERLINTLE